MAKKPRRGAEPSKVKLADSALWCAFCVSCELHSAQEVLDHRFHYSERKREWVYDYDPFPAGSPETGFTMKPTPVAWIDVVETLGRFRKLLAAAVEALPDLAELMDSKYQAVPDRWTFRVRLMLGELEGVYSHEYWERERLKLRGEPEEGAGNAMFRHPMGEEKLRRFWELCEQFKIRCAEVGLASDTSGEWRFPQSDTMPRMPKTRRGLMQLAKTSVQDQRIIALLNAGDSHRKVAKACGVGHGTVGRVASAYAVAGDPPQTAPLGGALADNLSVQKSRRKK